MISDRLVNGDRRQLKILRPRSLNERFQSAIRDRQKGEKNRVSRFVSIEAANLIAAELRGQTRRSPSVSCRSLFRLRVTGRALIAES